MGDIVGRLFREFAVTLAVTILVSAVVSLTLTPMMCARLLKHQPEAQQGRFYRVSERGFEGIVNFYARTLRSSSAIRPPRCWSPSRPWLPTIILFIRIPKGFFPIQDTGVIQGVSEAAETVSFRAMAARQQAAGPHHFEGSRRGKPVFVHRHRRHQHDAQQRAHPDQPEAARSSGTSRPPTSSAACSRNWPGSRASLCSCSPCRTSRWTTASAARSSSTRWKIRTPDELNLYAPKMLEEAGARAGTARCRQRPAEWRTARALVFDRDTASRLGITPATIDNTLYDAYGQRQVSTMFTQLNQYHVVLEVKHDFQQDPVDLRHLYIRSATNGSGTTGVVAGGSASTQLFGPSSSSASTSAASTASFPRRRWAARRAFGSVQPASSQVYPNGSQVPLAAFTHLEKTTVPITVNHQGQFPVVTLSFNLAPGASLGRRRASGRPGQARD